MSLRTTFGIAPAVALALVLCSGPSSDHASASQPPSLAAPEVQEPEAELASDEERPSSEAPAALRVESVPELSPFTPAMVANLRAIRDRSDRRQDDVFMKVGDSSTVSRGFLECFADPEEVELDGRQQLSATIAHFRRRHAGGRDSYRRRSRAAHEGWSARHVLRGNPPPLLAEVRAIRPRFAFVMNGGNDVEGRDPYQYATRMLRIVDLLSENGVIPILNSIPPRDDDEEADRWVARYNEISWAIARALQLPYLDYHQVMERLPRRGLAGDGVHPNIFIEGNRGHACRFGDEGLRYGHNARNLLALRGLDRLRRTVIEEEEPPAPAGPRLSGEGTVEDPFVVTRLPFADARDTSSEGSAALDAYGCGEQDESGRELVYRLTVRGTLPLRILAVSRRDADVDVHLLRGEPTGAACVERADREIVTTLTEGTWYVSVDTFSEGGNPRAGEVLVMLTPAR